MPTPEHQRLREITDDVAGWRRWGPYVSDRAWATVREDYSADGNAWTHLPHDLARSKAYRWGEDGIAAVCDRYQLLVFAPAFWNGRDPILKERLFGLTPLEGNHGEDVKECYFHLDNTPTHSYMKLLYKYPQAEFPYRRLVEENRRRLGHGPEFELIDTGVFDGERYFDIVIEYAKADPEDLCIRIEAHNRGPEPATLYILPHLWFRNTWGWGPKPEPAPAIRLEPVGPAGLCLLADDRGVSTLANIPVVYRLGQRFLYGPAGGTPLFTNNETNCERLYGTVNRSLYVKDAFHRWLIHGEACTNPQRCGSKAALCYRFDAVPAGGSAVLRLRLSDRGGWDNALAGVDDLLVQRRREADDFYATIHPPGATADERRVQRQAFAGLLWTKQSYLFDVNVWLDGDNPEQPPPASRRTIRNLHWGHLNSMRVLTVPDKWEYPWFAGWDLAFHCVALALVDAPSAKDQLSVLLFEQFQHPNGQIPAYEWEFSDLNPPVHAWAVWRVYNMDRLRNDVADRDFLERCFHKLLLYFAWWVNKVDRQGNNLFEGGFLGLDNIAVWDRSDPLPDGSTLQQSDATGWMGMFCLNMMRIALELAAQNPVYESMAVKFFQHYTYIAHAMKDRRRGRNPLWDEQDGYFYDLLRRPDGGAHQFRVRSLVGLVPLFAVERLEDDAIARFPLFAQCFEWFMRNRQDLVKDVVHAVRQPDGRDAHVLTVLDPSQLKRLWERVWDPDEFLSPFGIRSLSRAHRDRPFVYDHRLVGYEPAEAESKIKGSNSNWRGPIWFPTCFLLIESLRKLGTAYGPQFRLSPRGAGREVTFPEMAEEAARRLVRIFLADAAGRRPLHGDRADFWSAAHWRDHLQFYEYFHGDTGAGLGASHQTGWTALVASILDEWRRPA